MSQKENNILLITGSSRPHGNTNSVMESLSKQLHSDLVDLSKLQISYYDYEHKNESDDFLLLAQKMADSDIIILGSPIYWYSISAQMKTFLDRWSDLMTIRKDLGRALKGKHLMLISCGSRDERVPGFELPIEQTAGYMDMHFSGYFHTWLTDEESFRNESVLNRVEQLTQDINKVLNEL